MKFSVNGLISRKNGVSLWSKIHCMWKNKQKMIVSDFGPEYPSSEIGRYG